MRRGFVPLLLAAAFAAGSSRAAEVPLYAVVGYPSALVRLEPGTLKPEGRHVPTGGHHFGWSFSPEGSLAAAGTDGTAELRLYDVRAMRRLGDVDLGPRGLVLVSAWVSARRVIAVVVDPGCCGLGDTSVVAVDSRRRRVLWRRTLGGSYQDGGRFRRSFALVLGPKRTVGPSRLVLVGPDGNVRAAALPGIRSGIRHLGGPSPDSFRSEIWNPGLALDPSGRAFVVQRAAPVVEVDLRTMRVRSHVLAGGLLSAVKADDGPTRSALWLGDGRFAVTGLDAVTFRDAHGALRERETPAGLKLVDTRSWSLRLLDDRTTRALLVGGTLLGFGIAWDSAAQELRGDGLRGYRPDGALRFHVRPGDPISGVEPIRGRILVAGASGSALFRRPALLDPRTGQELRRLPEFVSVIGGEEPFWS